MGKKTVYFVRNVKCLTYIYFARLVVAYSVRGFWDFQDDANIDDQSVHLEFIYL